MRHGLLLAATLLALPVQAQQGNQALDAPPPPPPVQSGEVLEPEVTIIKREGATLHFGGDAPAGLERGAYVSPTLFGDVRNDMGIARNEIFGPVASVIPFEGPEEAIGIANDTIYGLAAGIWTRDLNKAMRLVKDIEAGVVWINSYEDGDMNQPFGGYKQSGHARDKCLDSLKSRAWRAPRR